MVINWVFLSEANSDKLGRMDSISPSTRDLARRILVASTIVSDHDAQGAVLVCDKIRISLTKFTGVDGFVSLQRRALVLARAEVPSLQCVKVAVDGRLQGFEEVPSDTLAAAEAAIISHLLELLATFVGQLLMWSLVREAWPDNSLDTSHSPWS